MQFLILKQASPPSPKYANLQLQKLCPGSILSQFKEQSLSVLLLCPLPVAVGCFHQSLENVLHSRNWREISQLSEEYFLSSFPCFWFQGNWRISDVYMCLNTEDMLQCWLLKKQSLAPTRARSVARKDKEWTHMKLPLFVRVSHIIGPFSPSILYISEILLKWRYRNWTWEHLFTKHGLFH